MEYGRGEQKTFATLPHLADFPVHLFRAEASLPRRRRCRGTRSGQLVRIKAWLAYSPELVYHPHCIPLEYGACFRCFVSRRALVPDATWLVPIVGLSEEYLILRPHLPRRRRLGGVNLCNLQPLSCTAYVADVPSSTTCALVNRRSVVNKTFILQDFFTSHDLDILFVTETWINVGESTAFTELLPPDCLFINSPRTTGRGGGIATVFKNRLYCKLLSPISFSSFELSLFELGRHDPVLCAVIFWLPKYNSNFVKDFSEFLAGIMTNYDRILVVGDFNVHVCCPSKPLAKDFLDLIDAFNFLQYVTRPTQEHGHTLDLALSYGLPIVNIQVCDAVFSDHMPVLFEYTLLCHGSTLPAPTRHHRTLKRSTAAQFSSVFVNLAQSDTRSSAYLDTENLTSSFLSTCAGILDTVAPCKVMCPRPKSEPWLNDTTHAARQECRRAER